MCVSCGCDIGARTGLNQEARDASSLTFVPLAKAEELEEGELAAYQVNGHRIAVARVGGAFHAFSDACSHMGAALSRGDLEDATVVCPAHGGRFDVRTGAVVAGPPTQPIRTYPVQVRDGVLGVEL